MDFLHVDDFVSHSNDRDPGTTYARWFLLHKRLPAVMQSDFAYIMKDHKLFAKHKNGKIYRCTGGSRMGDIWLTLDHFREFGYDVRDYVDNIVKWGPTNDI